MSSILEAWKQLCLGLTFFGGRQLAYTCRFLHTYLLHSQVTHLQVQADWTISLEVPRTDFNIQISSFVPAYGSGGCSAVLIGCVSTS